MTNAIIYTRVSTEEQVDGNSLEFQSYRLSEICKREGINVLKIFVEPGVSAKSKDNRPQLLAALSLARKELRSGDFFMVYDISRFSRNHYEGLGMLLELNAMGVLFRDAQRIYEDVPDDNFLYIIHSGLAELENKKKAKATRERMKSLAKAGQWMHAAFFGYRKGQQGERSLEIAPLEAEIVTGIFNRVARGESPTRIAESLGDEIVLTRRGGKVSTNRKLKFVLRILNDIKYIALQDTKLTDGVIKGDWEPLISADLFADVQRKLHGKVRLSSQVPQKYFLKSVLKCGSCNGKFTGETVKDGRYSYYRCFTCRVEAISVESAHEQFELMLGEISLSDDLVIEIKTALKDAVSTEVRELQNRRNGFEVTNERLRATLENLEDELLSNRHPELDRTRLSARIRRLQDEMSENQRQLSRIPRDVGFDLERAFQVLETMLSDIPSAFANMDDELKADFVFELLPEKVVCKDKTLQTAGSLMIPSSLGDSLSEDAIWHP